jgi:CelD/BcsL family acetyltransferase involved in cellulose biosynthesis
LALPTEHLLLLAVNADLDGTYGRPARNVESGRVVPVVHRKMARRDEDEARRAVAKLGSTVEKVLEESGMTEEELAHLFDLRRPMPE